MTNDKRKMLTRGKPGKTGGRLKEIERSKPNIQSRGLKRPLIYYHAQSKGELKARMEKREGGKGSYYVFV